MLSIIRGLVDLSDLLMPVFEMTRLPEAGEKATIPLPQLKGRGKKV